MPIFKILSLVWKVYSLFNAQKAKHKAQAEERKDATIANEGVKMAKRNEYYENVLANLKKES